MKKINKSILFFSFLLVPLIARADFADVEVTHPNYYAITSLEEEAVIRGYDVEGIQYFRPQWKVNRAEALKILTLATGITAEEATTKNFPDVKQEQWFYDPVRIALQKGIVQGYPNGKFHPEKEVTRAEFLKMLMMSFEIPFPELGEEEEWFVPYLETAKKLRLVDDPDPLPHKALTRGEVAEFIYRAQILSEVEFTQRYVYRGEGVASYYGDDFAGKTTANGEIFNPDDLTAAHRTLPFGTRLMVWNKAGRSVMVRINDRGPYHGNRVLDLSKKAFSQLADLSEGLLYVHFEVYSDTVEDRPTVPEQIRQQLSSESKNVAVPNDLASIFTNARTREVAEEVSETEIREPTATTTSVSRNDIPAYISGMIAHLPTDFFPNATLRREIPQKVVQGTVLNISGAGKESGKKEAIVFLQNLKGRNQSHFSAQLFGRNFVIPIMFLEEGLFELGLVFDDQVKSRVEKIEVVVPERTKLFLENRENFTSDLHVRIIPEEEQVTLSWTTELERLTKIVFSQEEKEKELFIEDGIGGIALPFQYFDDFLIHQTLSIDLFQALSEDGTLRNQINDWKKVVFKNFVLVPGFKDTETEYISVHKFPRFLSTQEPVDLDGKMLSPSIKLPESVYLITPEKGVKELPLKKNGDYFYFTVTPEGQGTYILEIVSTEGEVLFNRGMYFYDQQVLPLADWEQMPTRSVSVIGVRNWINQLRYKHRLERLEADAELNTFAQSYAQKMANDNFISHTSPEGLTFGQRVKMAKLAGEFGENLSYGSTFELAMNGLENSASHLQNILSRRWGRVGIGIAQNKEGEYYVVQMFGK